MNASKSVNGQNGALNLHVGDWVQIRDVEEILATLDDRQALDGLPFMPEMVKYCGKRFRVYKSAHKTCDTIERPVIRRMERTVHLEGLRCDGDAHGGCQASCLLFWKDAWLKRVPGPASIGESGATPSSGRVEALYRATKGDAEESYRCQATDLLKATTEVERRERWDPRFYIKDLTSGNVRLVDFVRFGIIAAFNAFMLRWRNWRYPVVVGLAGDKTPHVDLNLRPGDLVQVRSKEEIMRTLNSKLRNRGLWFDVEMVPFCENGEFKVLGLVEKIINEKTGRMMKLPNSCVILDEVACGGKLSSCRMFCPRSIYPYWHEIWLKPVHSQTSTLPEVAEGVSRP